ncbi:NAD(P)H-hydrate dehydratase [Brevundimonas aurifodinae]|uniref:ADP-dependent (S)-NAD(P)H-hydrate dehydratase n=1 Tax=Brevundimonas aurifodinae TaxID=1508312 RepID=A0ABV1NP54_9CAUL|nr:MAG: NAD(P)H-hydrate dehydratase [Caulobacterales bacterium 32-67-6]
MAEVNDPALWRDALPWPGAETHKHNRGRLGVVSGGPLNTGAARLAARAGLRVGAGLVKVLCPPDAAPIVASALEAVMVEAFASPDGLETLAEAMDAVVIGPAAGLNEATVQNLAALARTGAVLVVDADALTIFKGRGVDLFASLDRDDVLTPHEGEFERVFPGLLAQGREAAAREAATRAGCHVVLKGAETVIAAPDGRSRVNGNGSPWLATAGSGDVLAGLIGGLVAQGMASFEAASVAVWIHGAAAEAFGPGLIAEDLPDLIPAVLRGLRP